METLHSAVSAHRTLRVFWVLAASVKEPFLQILAKTVEGLEFRVLDGPKHPKD